MPDLPARGSHWTRTIAIGPDRKLLVSVGSSCNSCEERDRRRAAIYRYDARRPERRAVRDGASQRGRDRVPPRDVRALGHRQRARLARRRPPRRVRHAGRGRRLLRLALLPLVAAEASCPTPIWRRATDARRHGSQASSIKRTPRRSGLAFYTGSQFPADYRGDLFVALHGSWNRPTPVGYKVIRVKLRGAAPTAEDFATGWLAGDRYWGRPVDLDRGARRGALPVRRRTRRGLPDHLPGRLTTRKLDTVSATPSAPWAGAGASAAPRAAALDAASEGRATDRRARHARCSEPSPRCRQTSLLADSPTRLIELGARRQAAPRAPAGGRAHPRARPSDRLRHLDLADRGGRRSLAGGGRRPHLRRRSGPGPGRVGRGRRSSRRAPTSRVP